MLAASLQFFLSLTLSSHSALPSLLMKIEKKYSDHKTLTSDFVQSNKVAAFQVTQESRGKIWLKRPDRFRWETTSPDKNLLISNGKKAWFYVPPFDQADRPQVVVKNPSELKSKLASALLSGAFSIAKDSKVKQKGTNQFEIIPSSKSDDEIERALVKIDTKALLISQIVIFYANGNETTINLRNIKLGDTLSAKLFTFTPPPNAEIIGKSE